MLRTSIQITKIKATKNKVHKKNDCNYESVSNGIRRPISFSFALDILPGYEKFCEPETTHH